MLPQCQAPSGAGPNWSNSLKAGPAWEKKTSTFSTSIELVLLRKEMVPVESWNRICQLFVAQRQSWVCGAVRGVGAASTGCGGVQQGGEKGEGYGPPSLASNMLRNEAIPGTGVVWWGSAGGRMMILGEE